MRQKESNYKSAGKKTVITLDSEKNPEFKQVAELKGLCVNCDNRFICLMSGQVGGVWYCEEYE
jgi:hypothetical protein